MKTIAEFYDFYAKIPEDQWTTGKYVDDNGCKCALGHLDSSYIRSSLNEANLTELNRGGEHIPDVNDGRVWGDSNLELLGNHPKERILNYLVLLDSGILKEF